MGLYKAGACKDALKDPVAQLTERYYEMVLRRCVVGACDALIVEVGAV